jgi:hypothetical protein
MDERLKMIDLLLSLTRYSALITFSGKYGGSRALRLPLRAKRMPPQEACGLADADAANHDNRIPAFLPPMLRGKSATADGLLPSPMKPGDSVTHEVFSQ